MLAEGPVPTQKTRGKRRHPFESQRRSPHVPGQRWRGLTCSPFQCCIMHSALWHLCMTIFPSTPANLGFYCQHRRTQIVHFFHTSWWLSGNFVCGDRMSKGRLGKCQTKLQMRKKAKSFVQCAWLVCSLSASSSASLSHRNESITIQQLAIA